LGAATRVDKLEIRWPSGAREVVEVKEIDRETIITEGRR
jgi:hypothetical protein